jgi:thiamine kinase-like enzyme
MNRKISETSLDATTRYELHTRLESMPKHKKVCHGDFNPSNIIITPDNTPYIIDWAHVTQGNASADAARTYLLFWLDGNLDIAEKYISLFCKKMIQHVSMFSNGFLLLQLHSLLRESERT